MIEQISKDVRLYKHARSGRFIYENMSLKMGFHGSE